jgi:putative ABC transport system permease protein
MEDQLQSLGDNFVWIEAGSRSRNGMRAGARGTRSLVLSDAQAIVEQVPLIKSMSPNVDGRFQVVYGGKNWVTQFRGDSPEFTETRRWPMRLGTFFTSADVDAAAPVCVLGQTTVDNLFGIDDPTGKLIRGSRAPLQGHWRTSCEGIFCYGTGSRRRHHHAYHNGSEEDHRHILAG